MASLIVNQGDGPVPHPLKGLVVLGSNPGCDIVLQHPTALGSRVELKPLRFGYRVVRVKGELQLNEQACDMADLEHNDTLRLGEVMLLYKQPEGAEGFAAASGSDGGQAAAAGAARGTADEVPELAGLEPLDATDDLPQLEALEELDELEGLESLDAIEGLEELEPLESLESLTGRAAGGGRVRGPVEEIDLAASVHEPTPPSPALDEAYERAHWKRLEMLRRLSEARAGNTQEWPALHADGALASVQALSEQAQAELLAWEQSEGLVEASLRGLQQQVERAQREAARAERAARAREREEAARRQAAEREAAAREAAAREAAAREAAEREAAERERLAREQAEQERVERERAAAAALEALPELEPLEPEPLATLEDLEPLTDLQPLAAPASSAPTGRAPTRPERAGSAGQRAASRPSRAAPRPPAPAQAPGPTDLRPTAFSPAAWQFPSSLPAPPALPPADSRPLPAGGVRFRRPLPPGHRAPTYLPPVRPAGSPS